MAVKEAKKELKVIKTFKDGAALFNNGFLRSGVVRLSFVNFVTPKTNTNDDGEERESYGCAVLLPKGADKTPYKLACERFGKAELGDKYRRVKRKDPLREQDEKVGEYDGFEDGAWFFNTTTKFKPRATGRNKEEIDLSSFYSGCFARITFRPYKYDNKGNSGIGLGIAAVQFIRDGDPLGGGGIDPNDVFDADESDEMDDADGLL